MVTARQVAEKSGYSISTVGRALANDLRISAKTRARIRREADNLGYVANTPARIVRGGSSKLIGLMLPDIRNDFYATIAEALSKCCDTEGYQLAFSITNDRDTEARHLKELVSSRAAGIVIVPTESPRRETLSLLRSVPHAQLLRRLPSSSAAWFGIDDEECLRAGTEHLLGLGHRRIAYIGASTGFSTGAARLSGFRRAFAESGVDTTDAIEELGGPTLEFGSQIVFRLLASSRPPTALITGSVQVTHAVLDALHRLRVSVPSELSVVGFGDAPGFQWWGPGLTTWRMPIQELATSCGLWFLHSLKVAAPTEQHHVSIAPVQFVLRDSTAAL
jgi:DNA-binding LacI/PurR family transcriptional regulator